MQFVAITQNTVKTRLDTEKTMEALGDSKYMQMQLPTPKHCSLSHYLWGGELKILKTVLLP